MGNIQDSHLFGYDRNPSKSSEGFERLLKAIENECRRWPDITVAIRRQHLRLEEKRNYIKYQLQETVENITKPPASFETHAQAQTPRLQAQQEAADCVGGRKPQKDADQTNRLLEQNKQELTDLNQKTTSLYNETKVHSLQQENDSLEHQLKTAKHERDELSERLSKIVRLRIRENNPDIVNDPYRPTKLAEIYTELYANEWTNAYEALTQSGYDEQHAIETLELTLLDCWEFSQRTFTGILSKLDEVILDMMKLGSETEQKKRSSSTMIRKDPYKGKDVNYTREHLQRRWIPKTGAQQVASHEVKEGSQVLPVGFKLVQDEERKNIAYKLVPFVQNAYFKTLLTMDGVPPQIKAFIKRCLFFSWMAVAQSPPLWLDDAKPGTPLDNKLYKEYTRRGEKIEFIVWPALRLHQNGQVLAKGVAQGIATQK